MNYPPYQSVSKCKTTSVFDKKIALLLIKLEYNTLYIILN